MQLPEIRFFGARNDQHGLMQVQPVDRFVRQVDGPTPSMHNITATLIAVQAECSQCAGKWLLIMQVSTAPLNTVSVPN
jgi:hypothetical protein